MQDQKEDARLLRRELTRICEGSRYRCCSGFVQHGRTSVYRHSIRVAWTSLRLARFLGWRIDAAALVRAALLHDYFLYDWHIPGRGHRWHGFTHPRRALENALGEFELGKQERNAILRHMFPLTPVPPCCRIGWLVCLADKWCSLREIFCPAASFAPIRRRFP